MAKMTKASQQLMEQFGFEVAEPPAKASTRRSKYDEMWEAAREFLTANPGVTILVRTYTNPSAAYADSKAINNGEHRHFTDGDQWVAVAAPSTREGDVDEDGKTLYAVYLKHVPAAE